jgi:hypothetical protein
MWGLAATVMTGRVNLQMRYQDLATSCDQGPVIVHSLVTVEWEGSRWQCQAAQ